MIIAEVFTLCFLFLLSQTCYGYVELSHLTEVRPAPTATIPRPLQLQQDLRANPKRPQHPMITAVAPFLVADENGTHYISWSTTYHKYARHFQNARGIFKRHGRILRRDAALIATCTSCAASGLSDNQTSANVCYSTTNQGIFGTSTADSSDTICYGSSYAGILQSTSSVSLGLPCCSSCTPVANATATITTGIFGLTATANGTTSITIVTSTTIIVSGTSTSTSTVTVINQTSVMPQVTLSVTTITPTVNASDVASTTVLTGANTAIGCGTASGSGTVVGSGTVYLGPGGIFPVTSSGTVSGFASKVIGCGTMIATSGSFEGSATITGCGSGTGCAVLTGWGTVYPDALGGLIGISSSGTISGCGSVIGCGILTGYGTFTVTTPYTTTSTMTPTPALSTVNVYISYCPPDPLNPFRIGANLTSDPTNLIPESKGPFNNGTTTAIPTSTSVTPPFQLTNSTLSNTTTLTNSTLTNTTLTNSTATPDLSNPLCQICPEDSGICCPLFTACGADGHCPYTALQGAGYLRFGVNVVDKKNSSRDMGMVSVPGRIAPGLSWVLAGALGNGTESEGENESGDGGDGDELEGKVVKRHAHGRGHGHGHGHEHGGHRHRFGLGRLRRR